MIAQIAHITIAAGCVGGVPRSSLIHLEFLTVRQHTERSPREDAVPVMLGTRANPLRVPPQLAALCLLGTAGYDAHQGPVELV
jgi:hypothetical protein